jgi:UDP-N-acetylmuramoylalanine--D-glutamate ligase
MKLAILGGGISGKAAARLARKKEFTVKIFDDSPDSEFYAPPSALTEFNPSMAVTSPGIPNDSPLMSVITGLGIPFRAELDFACGFCKKTVIAVTGTNGKTTTVELTTKILSALGYNAIACGNIGLPLSEAITDNPEADVFITEVSSFQLDACREFAPRAAALLNIRPDHLDRYSGFDAYRKSKYSIFRNMPKTHFKIINSALPLHPENKLSFSTKDTSAELFMSGNKLYFKGKFKAELAGRNLTGRHNDENILAAAGLIAAFTGEETLDSISFANTVKNFRPGNHRQEIFMKKNGITCVNDSKATNPDAVLAAFEKFANGKNIRILLGGLDKNMDFSPLKTVQKNIIRAALIGESAKKIAEALSGTEHTIFDKMETATKYLVEGAGPGETIILSPGCASMDMFKNYIERGKRFKEIVSKITNC